MPSGTVRKFEPMFDSKKTFSRLADAIDLAIDFATLGEYGLEPAEVAPTPCQARRRSGLPQAPRRDLRRALAAK
jgi:hypothetical protein